MVRHHLRRLTTSVTIDASSIHCEQYKRTGMANAQEYCSNTGKWKYDKTVPTRAKCKRSKSTESRTKDLALAIWREAKRRSKTYPPVQPTGRSKHSFQLSKYSFTNHLELVGLRHSLSCQMCLMFKVFARIFHLCPVSCGCSYDTRCTMHTWLLSRRRTSYGLSGPLSSGEII